MIKIIEQGDKQFIMRCPQCNCLFSYEISDLYYSSVNCPNCGKSLDHNAREKQRNVKNIPSPNVKTPLTK